MKIPTEFKIFDNTIKVEFDNEYCLRNEVYGTARYKKNKITLSNKVTTDNKETYLPKTKIEQAFIHEMVHFILRETELDEELKKAKMDDERFVSIMSKALHQVLNTMIYIDTTQINYEEFWKKGKTPLTTEAY